MATELEKILNEPLSSRDDLLKHLEETSKVLKKEQVKKAFEEIDRKDFVIEDCKVEAYEDYALPIGHGQTISQPTTVAFMLDLLDPKEGEEVLDIGSGSGFTAALLGNMVGDDGKVTGIERIPELVEFSKGNLSKYEMSQIEIINAGDEVGYKIGAPYDKILISATSSNTLEGVTNQLKVGGVMVAPMANSIFKITKKENDEIEKEEYPGFVFVPLIEDLEPKVVDPNE